jgi:hypothetical protein
MFFHHGNFPKGPFHKPIGFPVFGMELMFGLCVGQELEKARERLVCSTCGDRECDRCGRPLKCHKEEFRG